MKKYKSDLKRFEIKANKTDFQNTKITSSQNAYDVIKNFYSSDIEVYESFFILLLNKANNTIGYAKISQGGIIGTVIDIKIIAKYCIDSLASNVIFAHNHPSGNKTPSNEDMEITRRTKEALKILEVSVLDHLILTDTDYYSFADNGAL